MTENKNEISCFTAFPCLGRYISTFITAISFSFAVLLCLVELGAHAIVCVLTSLILVSLNIILNVSFVKKTNSKVDVSDEGISQKQYSKNVDIRYDSITNITVKCSPWMKTTPLVTVFGDNEKISFETSSKIYEAFKNQCTNEEAIAMLRKALKKQFIYD